ncbi:MAG: HAD-IA family hydrolase [Vallitaleaceae bacterium]|nr:HAD-IA family hydrolase [Vallitaleaceae bacterium]
MKVVLFDFDGVLTIDAYGSVTIINYIVKKTGIDHDRFEKAYRRHNKELLLGMKKHEDIWEELCSELQTKIDYQILLDSFIQTELDDRMLSLAKKLREDGYRLGIVTDNKKDRIDAIVKHNRFEEIFEHIFISAELGMSKKEQETFIKVAETFAVEASDCVFIDNTKENLIAPVSLGMKTIFYDDEERDINRLIKELRVILKSEQEA